MTPIMVSARRLLDGETIPLTPTALTLTVSLNSPAAGLSLSAPVDRLPGLLGPVTVEHGEHVIFSGRVDQQTSCISGAGRTVALEARSKGALLLDNEALPCTLTNASLSTVFRICIQPYGFVLASRDPGGSLAQYPIRKGLSEWEALTGFVRRVWGRTPSVAGNEVRLRPPSSPAPLVIGQGGLGYTRLEQVHLPYEMLSKVVLRDAEGRYSSAVHNSAAGYYGVTRKRYRIPPSEFVEHPGPDANQMIRRSMLHVERVRVTVPGVVPSVPGQAALVREGGISASNWMIEEIRLELSPLGVTTALTLCNWIYFDEMEGFA